MRKRIFITIGAVMGAVLAFVGAVLGVLAIMGKFKTPVVRPEDLFFENQEQVIVAQYHDKDGNEILYSFELKGVNKTYKDFEVNHKTCYLRFYNNIGDDLITLCDAEGTPLKEIEGVYENGKYKINCNEKIYYKLKSDEGLTVDPESDINGKVVLTATTEDNMHNTKNEELVIWIDRSVSSVFLNYGQIPVAKEGVEYQEQQVDVGINIPLDISYVVNPEISLNPISKESEKVVELYYDPGDDFILVDQANLELDALKDIITYNTETQTYSFAADDISTHKFKIAIFPTYQAKIDFDASEYAKLDSTFVRLDKGVKEFGLVVTDLKINVVNTNVDLVSISEDNVILNLFAENDYISVRGESGVDKANDNNLQVTMLREGKDFDLRLSEIAFNATSSRYFGLPVFKMRNAETGVLDTIDLSATKPEDVSYNSASQTLTVNGYGVYRVDSKITIDGYKLINKLVNTENSGYEFHCNNGVALINDAGEFRVLKNGSYLDFYIRDEFGNLRMTTNNDFNYEAVKVEADYNTWQIKTKSEPKIDTSRESLMLGLLVVNNDGLFIVDNFFKTKEVVTNVVDLAYETNLIEDTLNVVLKGSEFIYDEKDFSNYISIYGGSYSAGIFVIEESELESSLVKTLDAYFLLDSKKYYIVGEMVNDKFVNKVIAEDYAEAKYTSTTTLQLLQLKNGYNEEEQRQQTAEEFITELMLALPADKKIDENNVYKLFNSEKVTIKQKLAIDIDSMIKDSTIKVETDSNGVGSYYEGTGGHNLYIMSDVEGLIARLDKFYDITNAANISTYFETNYPNVKITGINNDVTDKEFGGKTYKTIQLEFNLDSKIYGDPDVTIGLKGLFISGETYDSHILTTFKIASSAPENIMFSPKEGVEATLTKETTDADIPVVVAKISWDEVNGYKTTWSYGGWSSETFNLNTEDTGTKNGFYDETYKINHSISCDPTDNCVVKNGNSLEAVSAGTSYLAVTMGGETRYLKITVSVEGFGLTKIKDSITGTTGKLTELISYYYDDDLSVDTNEVTTITNLATYAKLDNFTFQHADKLTLREKNVVDGKTYTYVFENTAKTPILGITKTATDWEFTRIENVYSALTVRFKVDTKTKTLDVTLNFEQDVMHDLNVSAWGEKPKLYAGTTILLYEVKKSLGEFTNQPLLKIINKGNSSASVASSNGVVNNNGTIQILDGITEISFTISVGGIDFDPYTFDVVPNVVVKQSDSAILEIASGTTYNFDNKKIFNNDLIKLYNYNSLYSGNTLVFGQTQLTGGQIALYSNNSNSVLTDCTEANYQSLILSSTYVNKASGSKDIVAKLKEEIGFSEHIEIKVSFGSNEIGTISAKFVNNYFVACPTQTGNEINIKAMINIAKLFKVDGGVNASSFYLTSIAWTSSDADNNYNEGPYTLDGEILKIPTLSRRYDNATLTLTFSDGTNTLTYTGKTINNKEVTINVVPFELEPTNTDAYSEKEFKLLEDVYSKDDIDLYITKIEVLSVLDASGNSLTGSTLGIVYSDSVTDRTIEFYAINVNETKAYITYLITYIDNVTTYEYTKEITLSNRQEIEVKRPYGDGYKLSDNFKYDDNSAPVYLENVVYEPVVVNVSNGTTIDLINYDKVLHISRLVAKDRATGNVEDLQVRELKLIAYQNSIGIKDYINKGITINNGKITLPKGENIDGVLIFKLTSTTGYSVEYAIRVYGARNSKVNVNNYTEVFEVDSSKSIKDVFDENIKNNFNATYGVIYTESVVDMSVLDAVTLVSDYKEFDGTIFTSVNRYNKITTETPNITNYTKITIGFVYKNGADMHPLGTATLNYLSSSLPKLTSGTQGVEGDDCDFDFNKKVTDKETGEYTALLDPNATQVNNPLTGYSIDTSKSIYSSDYIGEIDADNNIKIKTRNTSNENYKFTIFYVKDGVYVKVEYTYPKLSIPEEKYVTVGTVKVDSDDDENSYFDNSVEINGAYLGDYKGNITVEGKNFIVSSDYKFVNDAGAVLNVTKTSLKEDCYYEITNGIFKITFDQGLMDAEREIEINFTEAGIKRTHTFLVKAGVQVNTSSDSNNGVYEAQRKVTVTPNGGLKFDQLTGTVIPITKTSIQNGDRYTIGGYSIYIKDAGKLKILFAEEYQKYVVEYANLGDTLADTVKYVTDGTNINFVHLAVPAGVNLTAQIYVLNNSGEYYKVDELTNLVNNFYINVAPTYSDIESVYVTNGAKAENVVKGDKTIIDLASHLLTNITAITDVSTNGARLRLKKLDKSYLNSGFAGMGLKEYGNPNYLNFSVQNGAVIKTNSNIQAIEFSDASVSNNQMCNVTYGNNAGISDKLYKFQIMASTRKEGIEFSTEAYSEILSSKGAYLNSDYISFAVNKDSGEDLTYTTGVLYIGKLKDGENVKTYLQEISLSGISGELKPYNTDYNFGSKVADIREKYVYTAGDYTIAIAVTSTLEIYLKLDRASSGKVTPFNQITISLKLHGSTDYIFNGFEIVLFNVDVGGNEGIDTSIHGGETVTLINKLTIPSGATLEFDWENSEYGIGNLSKFDNYFEDVLILYSGEDEIGYNGTDNVTSIKFQPVGQNVTLNLVFKVKLNGKYVSTVTYKVLLYKNLQMSFNGDIWETKEELKDDSQLTYTTYFVLTNGADTDNNFGTPLTIQFTSNSLICETIDVDSEQGAKNVYYKKLAFGVYDTTDPTLSWSATIRKNTNMPNPSDDVCVVNNNGITFKQDYTGKLYLIVQVTLTNGFNYVVYWEIDVTGILQFDQVEKTENGVISNNGIEFESGSDVKLINSAKSADTGLMLIKDGLFGTTYINYGIPSLAGEYVVVKYNPNDGKTNAQRFNSQTTKVPVTGSWSGDRFETKLPIVASGGQYLVIYKVNLTYLNYTTQDYYIAYLVKNDLNISIASVADITGSNVNVDTRLFKEDEKYYLDLFYFEEKIIHDETTYSITYNGTDKVLKISNDTDITYIFNSTTNRYEYNDDGILNWYIFYYDNGTGEYTISYGEGEGTATDIENIKTAECVTKYTDHYEGSSTAEITDDKYYLSVFDVKFNNVEEYEQFVKSVCDSNKYTIKIGNVYFKLKHIGYGRFGIDLTAGHTRTDNGDGTFTYKALKDDSKALFNNDLVADLTLLSIAGDPIYTLNNFELTTNSTITAKDTIKLSTLFAPSNIVDIDDCDIIGIYSAGNPVNEWVNNGTLFDKDTATSGVQPDITDISTIKVQTDKTSYATYTLQKVKYASSSAGGITGVYSLDAEFFVVKAPENYGGKVYKANYNTVMVNPFAGGDTVIDISNTFKVYYFDTTIEKFKEDEDSIKPTAITEITTNNITLTISTDDYKLIAAEATLADYKNSHPDDRYVTCYYSAVVETDITLYCGFTFGLPTDYRVVNNYNEGSLLHEITIPSNIKDIISIQEVGSNYADNDQLKNKTIDLDTSLLQAYFATNDRLEIEFLITTENGNETLIVVLNKVETPAE